MWEVLDSLVRLCLTVTLSHLSPGNTRHTKDCLCSLRGTNCKCIREGLGCCLQRTCLQIALKAGYGPFSWLCSLPVIISTFRFQPSFHLVHLVPKNSYLTFTLKVISCLCSGLWYDREEAVFSIPHLVSSFLSEGSSFKADALCVCHHLLGLLPLSPLGLSSSLLLYLCHSLLSPSDLPGHALPLMASSPEISISSVPFITSASPFSS